MTVFYRLCLQMSTSSIFTSLIYSELKYSVLYFGLQCFAIEPSKKDVVQINLLLMSSNCKCKSSEHVLKQTYLRLKKWEESHYFFLIFKYVPHLLTQLDPRHVLSNSVAF